MTPFINAIALSRACPQPAIYKLAMDPRLTRLWLFQAAAAGQLPPPGPSEADLATSRRAQEAQARRRAFQLVLGGRESGDDAKPR